MNTAKFLRDLKTLESFVFENFDDIKEAAGCKIACTRDDILEVFFSSHSVTVFLLSDDFSTPRLTATISKLAQIYNNKQKEAIK